jgi:hypothetical protein
MRDESLTVRFLSKPFPKFFFFLFAPCLRGRGGEAAPFNRVVESVGVGQRLMQLPRQFPPYLTPVSSSLNLPSPLISQFVDNDDAAFYSSVTSPIPFTEHNSSSKRSIEEAYSFKDDVSGEEESHAPSESEAEDELPDEDQTRIFSDEGARCSPMIAQFAYLISITAVPQNRPRDGLRRVPRGAWSLAN